MLWCLEIKQELKLWVVLLFEHDGLLKGAAVLHDVQCHGVNDVPDTVIRWKHNLNVWLCKKHKENILVSPGKQPVHSQSTVIQGFYIRHIEEHLGSTSLLTRAAGINMHTMFFEHIA